MENKTKAHKSLSPQGGRAMKVYLNEITGVADAITSMYFSKRTWTREMEIEIRRVCDSVLDHGNYNSPNVTAATDDKVKFTEWIEQLTKWGWKHTTMLRFVDLSITVEGLHRGGQDDWDAHAKRYNNRIIRSSTRLSTFGSEMSEWYQGKIIPTDVALTALGLTAPDTIEVEGITYVKTVNGYIREDLKNNKDVKRGLYMLSIPSNFIFKCDLTEYGHVYKERNATGTANPEVKMVAEDIVTQVEAFLPWFNKELLLKILN